jgi:hypothetical protein
MVGRRHADLGLLAHRPELPHRGGFPRRLAARQRWLNRRATAPATDRQRRRQDAADRDRSPAASRVVTDRGVPKIVALARSQTATGDDADGG